MKHTINIADENLFRAISDPVELGKRTNKLQPYLDYAEEQRQIQREIGVLGKYQNTNGFTTTRKMQRVAAGIPAAVLGMMQQIDPEFMKDKRKFYRWLAEHPEYDVRGKVVL